MAGVVGRRIKEMKPQSIIRHTVVFLMATVTITVVLAAPTQWHTPPDKWT